MIEAIHIYDDHNTLILSHIYTGRPPPSSYLLSSYLSQSSPRPPLISLPSANPPTHLYSVTHDRLLLFATTTTTNNDNTPPLSVFEFLYRIIDAFTEFLGAPLLPSKIESSYDVAAQLLSTLADAGSINTTEPDALREVVEIPSLMNSLLGNLGLGSAAPFQSSAQPSPLLQPSNGATQLTSAIPWRRANVKHTSNELYVDIVESLSVILAPSGRPLSALSHGTIAFTSKISGIPDLLLSLSTSAGGPKAISTAMALPTFHPCVRLARWREKPGDLSFVPPDGRFVLATYECDLLPSDLFSGSAPSDPPRVELPVTIQLRRIPSDADGAAFEAQLTVARLPRTASSGVSTASAFGSRLAGATAAPGSRSGTPPLGTAEASAAAEDIVATIPLPPAVRNVPDVRPQKGEAHFLPAERCIEWRVGRADVTPGGAPLVLRCTVVGAKGENEQDAGAGAGARASEDAAALLPRSAALSFAVKGWLPSGVRVDGLALTKASRGLGHGVSPYKGVKYHTVSRRGVEARIVC